MESYRTVLFVEVITICSCRTTTWQDEQGDRQCEIDVGIPVVVSNEERILQPKFLELGSKDVTKLVIYARTLTPFDIPRPSSSFSLKTSKRRFQVLRWRFILEFSSKLTMNERMNSALQGTSCCETSSVWSTPSKRMKRRRWWPAACAAAKVS